MCASTEALVWDVRVCASFTLQCWRVVCKWEVQPQVSWPEEAWHTLRGRLCILQQGLSFWQGVYNEGRCVSCAVAEMSLCSALRGWRCDVKSPVTWLGHDAFSRARAWLWSHQELLEGQCSNYGSMCRIDFGAADAAILLAGC